MREVIKERRLHRALILYLLFVFLLISFSHQSKVVKKTFCAGVTIVIEAKTSFFTSLRTAYMKLPLLQEERFAALTDAYEIDITTYVEQEDCGLILTPCLLTGNILPL